MDLVNRRLAQVNADHFVSVTWGTILQEEQRYRRLKDVLSFNTPY